MSFYVYGHHDLRSSSLATIVALAVEGKIPEALQKWKRYLEQTSRCVCGNDAFDQVRCGFCLSGKLLYLELMRDQAPRGVDFLKTAHVVSAFVGKKASLRRKAAPFTKPAAREAAFHTW